jgi:hypothetical protein
MSNLTNTEFSPSSTIQTIPDMPTNLLSGLVTRSGNRFFDNSTLDTMRVCPRRFYYSHIRHWQTDSVKAALIFGTCWHSSMDFLWQNPKATWQEAFDAFMKEWNNSELAQAESFDLFPRSPGRAAEMLQLYVERYADWLQTRIELVAIEKAFIVPLTEEDQKLFYVGKWDKLYKEGRFYYILDHKTSSSFASTWLNGWSPNGQVDGYLYAGHMEYGDDFKGVIIDGALVQKTKLDFLRIPVERQQDMLNQWKWEVVDLIDQIKYYETTLLDIRESKRDTFLKTYPKCTTSCNSYYGACPFLNLCKFISNPEDIKEVPDGYALNQWRPFNIEEDVDGKFIVRHIHGAE